MDFKLYIIFTLYIKNKYFIIISLKPIIYFSIFYYIYNIYIMELQYGVWLDFPENKPKNNKRCLIRRKGYGQLWEPAVYNEDYDCWDDGEGDDYLCDLDCVDKIMVIPEIK